MLLDNVPELKEEENQRKLVGFLKDKGLNDQEINSLYDARFLQIAEEARRYRELVKEGVKPKKKAKTPNVAKKKGKATPKAAKQQGNKVLADKLKQTGHRRDAAALIKQMGL